MAATLPSPDDLDRALATPEGRADPYPLYRPFLEQGDLYRSERDGIWYAFRYPTCRALLRDGRLGHDQTKPFRRPGTPEIRSERLREHLAQRRRRGLSMLTTNPPDHTRLRGLVNRAFTPRRVEGLRESVAGLVDEHLDRIAEAGEADVMSDLALPLPVAVISRLVGIPLEAARLVTPMVLGEMIDDGGDPSEEQMERFRAGMQQRLAFFQGLIAQRRESPQDDMLSALVAVRDSGGDRLSESELFTTVILLYFAGFVTTTNLIGNGLLALLRAPEEMARLWADPALVPPAVEEMLRYDSPVQFVLRDVLEPVETETATFATGDTVVTMLGAANRDPDVFAQPDRFDVARPGNHPLSFGAGIHFCLGAPLARLEAQVVFGRMRERFAGVEATGEDEPPRAPGFLRGVRSLPVRVRPR